MWFLLKVYITFSATHLLIWNSLRVSEVGALLKSRIPQDFVLSVSSAVMLVKSAMLADHGTQKHHT